MTDPKQVLVRLSETLTEGLEFDLVATYLRTSGQDFERITGDADLLPGWLPDRILGSKGWRKGTHFKTDSSFW